MSDAPLTQQYSDVRLYSPLRDDRLLLIELSGSEYVNEVGLFRLRVMTSGSALSSAEIDLLIGDQIKVRFDMGYGMERLIIQTCFGLRKMGSDSTSATYELELRPWIWMLSRRQNSRIFHMKSAVDIIQEVVGGLSGVNGALFENKAGASYPVLEYTVQYQETDLNFVRRLMEEFGINFHIEMRADAQYLVLTDSADDFAEPIARHRGSHRDDNAPDALSEIFEIWIAQRHLTTGAVRMTDYNFKTPDMAMQVSRTRESAFSPAQLESFEHPGRYVSEVEGTPLVQRRLDALRGADSQVRASGHAPSLGAGMRFLLNQHEDSTLLGQYAVMAATHHYFAGEFSSGGNSNLGYHGEYSLVSTDLAIAPERLTPRPYVRGPQSAVVTVGADGEVDEYGRIKVKFPWDQIEETMYCRVSQMWAGAEWGTQFIPRVGMEVLVDFMEGDPDRPVIVGCLYNETNQYPRTLPEKKSTSGFKTQTMGGDGYNALIFEDKADAEEIFIHAQKDLMIKVLDRELVEVDGDSKRTIDGKSETIVGGEKTTTVTGAISIESYDSIELKVGSSSIKIEPMSITISAAMIKVEAQGQLEASGLMTKITGSTNVTIQAATVMIN